MLSESVARDYLKGRLLVALPVEIGKNLPGFGILVRKHEPLSEPAERFTMLLRKYSAVAPRVAETVAVED